MDPENHVFNAGQWHYIILESIIAWSLDSLASFWFSPILKKIIFSSIVENESPLDSRFGPNTNPNPNLNPNPNPKPTASLLPLQLAPTEIDTVSWIWTLVDH